MPPCEPLSRNRTSQLTGNRARRRAAGCVREQEREGGGQEGVHPGQQKVRRCKGPGLPPGTRPFQDLGPRGVTDCRAHCKWRRRWVSLPRTPPPLLEPRLKGLSPGQRPLPLPPPRVNSLPDLGPTILAGGQWGSFSLFTCCAGRATRNPNAGGAARPRKPPPSLSLPELQPLDHLPPQRPRSGVRPGSQTPEHRDFCS